MMSSSKPKDRMGKAVRTGCMLDELSSARRHHLSPDCLFCHRH
jgi:hypothetical protein